VFILYFFVPLLLYVLFQTADFILCRIVYYLILHPTTHLGVHASGLTRGLATHKVHPGAFSGQRQRWKTHKSLVVHCFCV